MNDIINDIFLSEDPRASETIDVSGFFPHTELGVLSHNHSHIFQDMKSGEGKKLNITKKHTLTIKKPRQKNLEDLYNQKKYTTKFLQIFSKQRIIRPNPISILSPLPRPPFNTIDIRSLEPLISLSTHPDIYILPIPHLRRVTKTLRKQRKRIIVGSLVFVTLSVSLVFLSLAAKNYVEQETIHDYNRISALKDMRDINAISQEIQDIHASFSRISTVFSPFRAILDNRFYSHPQVHLAGNVIHGGLALSDSLEKTMFIAQSFMKELPKDGSCNTVFFGSGGIAENGCKLKITDFLKEQKNNLSEINTGLETTLSYYAGIESLGNPLFDEKLQKNMQSLLGIKEILTFSLAHFDDIMRMLGDTKPEQYMIINQNQDELRANGGFPGSILSFELYKGQIQKFEKHDVYDYDWKLYPYKETPPSGLEGYSGNF